MKEQCRGHLCIISDPTCYLRDGNHKAGELLHFPHKSGFPHICVRVPPPFSESLLYAKDILDIASFIIALNLSMRNLSLRE